MDKILVKVYVPMLEKIYDVWIPSHKRIYNVIDLLIKAVNELNDNCYKPNKMPMLYDKITAKIYDINLSVKESTMRSGTEIVLL
ncbi:MAG: methyltransferase [Clostridia bacterium]